MRVHCWALPERCIRKERVDVATNVALLCVDADRGVSCRSGTSFICGKCDATLGNARHMDTQAQPAFTVRPRIAPCPALTHISSAVYSSAERTISLHRKAPVFSGERSQCLLSTASYMCVDIELGCAHSGIVMSAFSMRCPWMR